jgi:type VI secretion system protein ImpF
MAQPVPASRLMPSLIDRLTDSESMGGATAGYGFKQMIDSVRVDLEDLLNTRRSCGALDPSFAEVESSIVAYGLPELNEYAGASPEHARKLEAAIVKTINRFETVLELTTGKASVKAVEQR